MYYDRLILMKQNALTDAERIDKMIKAVERNLCFIEKG